MKLLGNNGAQGATAPVQQNWSCGVRVKFQSRKFELPFRSGDQLRTPFTVRVDVGVHSGTVIVGCTTSPGGNAQCPAH